jgi:hypothetical protein
MIRGGKIEDRSAAAAAAAPPSDDGSDIMILVSGAYNDVAGRRGRATHHHPEPAPAPPKRTRRTFSFPLVFVGLLLLSLGVFCGLFYVSVRMVIVEEERGGGGGGDRDYHLLLPSLLSLQDDDDDDDVDVDPAGEGEPPIGAKQEGPHGGEKPSATTRAKSMPTRGRSRPTVDKKKGAAVRRQRPEPTTPAKPSPPATTSPYAYVFLLAGCDVKHPESYRPLLSSIYVAIHLLRQYGSTQDAIVYVMMMSTTTSENDDAAAPTTNSTTKPTIATLSADELRVLAELNATVRQIPSVSKPTFHRVMLQKFRVLGLTQYKRVMFLDCDVMPLVNLDVFFELSDPAVTPRPVLKENLIFLDYVSPANGGTFMLSPRPGDLEQVNGMIKEAQLLRNKGIEGKEPWRQFKPDRWDAFDKSGTQYDFHAVSGDQGLLWSWVRHYQRHFSHVVKDGIVKNYAPSDTDNTSVRLESVLDEPFAPDHDPVWPVETSVWGTLDDALRYRAAHPPKPGTVTKPHDAHMGAFGALFHFLLAGGGKPWYREGCKDRWDAQRMPAHDTHDHAEKARRFWCQTYHEITVLHNFSVPASDLHSLSKAASYHPSIGSEMWATPGPVTNLLEPDFDPRRDAASSQ